jgi:hypothetical protein
MDILHRRERQKANKENAKQRAREYVAEYFATHPCTDCGESDPVVLTFDHIPGEHIKRGNISDMIQNGLGLETIKSEIAKTEVVCYNCHSLREQARKGAYRFPHAKTGKLL